MKITPYKYPWNFAKVDETLYRSSQPNPWEIEFMKKKIGLTDIFNVSDNTPVISKENELLAVKRLGIKYHAIPTRTENPVWENINKFTDSVNKLKKTNAKVLVHCNAGVDRTGTYVLFYQLINGLKNFKDGVEEMLRMGHNPQDVPQLLPRIKEIAKKMKFIR